jgi:single stranded DNA-binding protein
MNRPCTIVGNVGGQPELRYTPSGTPVLNFSLALYAGKEQETSKEVVTWVRVTAWKDLAETVNKKVSKGDKLQVEGYLQPARLYEKKDKTTGKVMKDEKGHPILDAAYEMTAFSVTALTYTPVELVTLPDAPIYEHAAKG